MRIINHLVIHCSATEQWREVSVDEIRQWHLKRGFNDIGYHFVIDLNGIVHKGRPVETIGAHAQGYNANSIGICYVGGLARGTHEPMDTRTPKQKESLINLTETLKNIFGITRIDGHRDLSVDFNGDGVITPNEWMKSCPCFDVHNEFMI
jgi:N-acetyl-anhydromuramyl-L-alanine amidase AmpD